MRLPGGHHLALLVLPLALAACGRDVADQRHGPPGAGSSLIDADYPGCRAKPEPSAAEPPLGLLAGLAARSPAALQPRVVGRSSTVAGEHFDVRYFDRDGHPVCGEVASAHLVHGRVWVDGEPSLPDVEVTAGGWATEAEAADAVRTAVRAGDVPFQVTKSEACLAADRSDGTLRPAWDLYVTIGARPFHAVATRERVVRVEALDLHLDAEASVYADNPLGKLTSYRLTGLGADGRLDDGELRTGVPDGTPPAAAAGGRFDFAPDDARFAETSVFVHARRMLEWQLLPEHGFSVGCPPLLLDLHVVFSPEAGGVNNAQYFPPEANPDGLPHVKVGDGDGLILSGLPLDFDVVGHELGHHVVYRRLKTFSGESLVLHEGLADALLFAMTGDPCLGESICPAGSSACVVPGRCLRSAENSLRFTDPDLPAEAHRRSQLVSGLLWDLGKQPGFGNDLVANLIFHAVDYLLPASGYHDLVKALMNADLELARGTHACAVLEEAKRRGFGDAVADLDCQDFQAKAP